MNERYKTISTLKLNSGEIHTSEPKYSEYDFFDGFEISEKAQLEDYFVDFKLGNGKVITIRPSDIHYIGNQTIDTKGDNPNEESD